MLQLQLEVRTIQFYINSMTEFCQIQFIHNLSSTPLKSILKCRCRDIQEIRERIDLNIQYYEKGNLRLQIYDGQIIFGEAIINLGFYIENSLPVIIDNITIQSKYDQEAYVEMSLGWNQLEQIQNKEYQQTNPIREQPLFIKLSQQTTNRVPIDHYFENRTLNTLSSEQNYFLESKQEQINNNKSIELKKQLEDEKIEDIPKAHLEITNSRRFQTPKDSKLAKKQKIQKSSGLLEHYKTQINSKQTQSDSKPIMKEQGLRILQKSSNRFDSRAKIRIQNHQNEDNDQGTTTKQKHIQKKAVATEDLGKQSQKYLEAGFFTSRQLEIDLQTEKECQQISIQQLLNENQLMKNQLQKLSLENQDLKDQLMKSEAAFNLLSETYTTLRNEYKKVQIKNYDSSNNTFIMNKEYEFIKKEIEQKQKEIEFNQKETQLWKIELEIIKRENIQLQMDLEQMKKEVINKNIENNDFSRDIQEKQLKINTLEQELIYQQVNQPISQDINLQDYSDEQNNLEQMRNIIKNQKIQIDNYYQELKQTKQKLLFQEKGGKQLSQCQEEIQQINSQLQLEINQLKQKLIDSNQEIKSKTLEIEKLKTQINLYLQLPDKQNFDLTYLINEYSTLNASLKQENQTLVHQNRKDQVKLESLQKQLGINKRKNIVDLSEQRQQSLEKEISQLEKAVLNGKQNMADVINAVLECGGPDLAEAVERFLIARRSMKIS